MAKIPALYLLRIKDAHVFARAAVDQEIGMHFDEI
jgi:hypothetical protein